MKREEIKWLRRLCDTGDGLSPATGTKVLDEVERLRANLAGANRVLWSIISDLGGEVSITRAKALEALDPNCVLERVDEYDGSMTFIAHKEGIDK